MVCDNNQASLKAVSETRPKGWLNRTVAGAGITSAMGDFCYETTTVILPGLLSVLGIPAAALGIIEGIADAVAAFTKMISGYIADKLGHRKLLVLIGYSLTPVGQALIAMAVGWPLLLFGRIVSWFGKGLRGPLRDAIIPQAISPETRGRAFGFHRAADTIGAVMGPLLGVALLGWAQGLNLSGKAGPFQLVLWLSVIPGALAVLAFLTLVHDPERSPNPVQKHFSSLRGLPPFKAIPRCGRHFRHRRLLTQPEDLPHYPFASSLCVNRRHRCQVLLYVVAQYCSGSTVLHNRCGV
jgi:predicted MFS family arabinose efflux permease